MQIFPRRQWTSNLSTFPGRVSAGDVENAVPTIPLQGPHLTGFSYSPSTLNLTVGVPIVPITPTVLPAGAQVRVFQVIMQVLPPGVSVDTVTGVISGTPTAARPATVYRIYAQAAYSYVAEVTITVT